MIKKYFILLGVISLIESCSDFSSNTNGKLRDKPGAGHDTQTRRSDPPRTVNCLLSLGSSVSCNTENCPTVTPDHYYATLKTSSCDTNQVCSTTIICKNESASINCLEGASMIEFPYANCTTKKIAKHEELIECSPGANSTTFVLSCTK